MLRPAALSSDVELAETLASALPGFQRLHRALASAASSPSVPPSALAAWLGDLPSRLGGRAAMPHKFRVNRQNHQQLLDSETINRQGRVISTL